VINVANGTAADDLIISAAISSGGITKTKHWTPGLQRQQHFRR